MKYKNLLMALVAMLWSVVALAQTDVERREAGNLITEGVPDVPEAIQARMGSYLNTRSAGIASWHPQGQGMLISTRFGETAQLHWVKTPGAARQQITFFNEPVRGGTFCPNPNYNGFMFLKDAGGNEYAQLFWFDMATGSYTMLSDGESINTNVRWNNGGDKFAFVSTRGNTKDYYIYLSDMASPKEAKALVTEKGRWIPGDWSPDNRYLTVNNYLSINKANLFVYDTQTGEMEAVLPSEDLVYTAGGMWSADGKGFFYVSDEGSEFKTLRYFETKKKRYKHITKDIPWDVANVTFNKDRSQFALNINQGGMSNLMLMDPKTFELTPLKGIPPGQARGLRFSPDGKQLAFTLSSARTAGDVYSIDLASGELTRWTYSEVGGLATETFAEPTLIEFETFDKVDGKARKIPAFYFKPSNKPGPYPVVISIHGGPEGQYRPGFSSFTSYMVNEMGVAVIAPNVRGSSGYGKTYLKLDNGMKREQSVQDIGELIDWIGEQPELDGERIAVMGGSYGGYMVLASMFHFNDKLRCGIDIVGISNFVTFLENTKDYRRDLRRPEYGDERDPEMRKHLEAISPTNHADEIQKPLYIIQGANDPRVPYTESEQMVEKIRNSGGKVWYMLAMDEGHGFRKKSNRDAMQQSIIMFLEENLFDEAQ